MPLLYCWCGGPPLSSNAASSALAAALLPQEAEAAATKQRATAARSLEQLREGLAAKAADVGRKIDRANKRAGKMPELAQMLAPFLG